VTSSDGKHSSVGGSNGPWGSPNPSGTDQGPSEYLQKFLDKGQRHLRSYLSPNENKNGNDKGRLKNDYLVVFAILVALVIWGVSGFYRVESDEVGIGLVFGKPSSIAGPGLNYNWPYPIGKVYTTSVLSIRETNIGSRQENSQNGVTVRLTPEEGQMLTGDENLVDVDFKVQWDVKNASRYLFEIYNPEGTVKAVAESAMREVIGHSDLQRVITEDRRKVEISVQQLMQQILDKYESGVRIRSVQMQQVDPPPQVIDAFRDVQAARIDAERMQNEAEAEANKIIPKARGRAFAMIQRAKAHRHKVVEIARGQADHFLSILTEYKKFPSGTRERLYIEAMDKILSNADKVIMQGSAPVQPYAPIDLLSKNSGKYSTKEMK